MQKNTLILLISLLSSCFSDIGNYNYTSLDEIIIEEVPEGLGDLILFEDTIRINPVAYLGNNKKPGNFNYYWSLKEGTGSTAKMIRFSEEKNLVFPVHQAGEISLMLEVENKETGIIRFKTISANGTSRMSNGYYLLKENSNGTTDVDMIGFDSETGESVIFANLLESTFDTPLEGSPVALDYWGYRYEDFESASLVAIPSIRIISEKDAVVINPDKFEIVSRFDDLFLGDAPSTRNIQAFKSIQKNTILINDGKAYCFVNYYSEISNNTEYKEFGGNKFYPALLGDYNLSENISWPVYDNGASFLTYDNKSGLFKYIIASALKPQDVKERSTSYFKEPLNANLLFMESTATGAYAFNVYALLQDKQYPDSLLLIDMYLNDLNQGYVKQNNRTKLDAKNYLIDNASHRCVHQLLQTIYFSIGDKLYKHNPENNTEELLMTFNGNEITHLDVINEWYTLPEGKLFEMEYVKMIVATQQGDNYNFMKFDMNNDIPSLEPIFSETGSGKITDYMYIKPSTLPAWVRTYN